MRHFLASGKWMCEFLKTDGWRVSGVSGRWSFHIYAETLFVGGRQEKMLKDLIWDIYLGDPDYRGVMVLHDVRIKEMP